MTNYDFSLLQANTSQLTTLVQVTNDATNGILVGGLLLAIFIVQVAMFSAKSENILGSLAVSSWLTLIYGTFFFIAGLVNIWVLLGLGSIAAISTVILAMFK